MNQQLVRSGMAKVKHLEGLASNEQYIKFSDKLLRDELSAAKKGKGVWQMSPIREQVKTYFVEKVTDLLSPFKRFFGRFQKTK